MSRLFNKRVLLSIVIISKQEMVQRLNLIKMLYNLKVIVIEMVQRLNLIKMLYSLKVTHVFLNNLR